MNETQLQNVADEITDSTSTSVIAIIGFLISLVGLFSFVYVETLPLAIISCLMGAIVLLTANRFRLNWPSRILGFLALVIGATSASWSTFERSISTNYDLVQAKKIAELYLNSLSSDDMDKVYYLVGFPFDGGSPEEEAAKATDIERAKMRLKTDAAHMEIQSRKTPAKWTFVGLEGEIPGSAGYTYRLRFHDEGQTVPSAYWVYARKDCEKYEIKDNVRWFVDRLGSVKHP